MDVGDKAGALPAHAFQGNYSSGQTIEHCYSEKEAEKMTASRIKDRYAKFPDELKKVNQWVCWRIEPGPDGKPRKIPVNPRNGSNAKPNDPTTWSDFEAAVRCADKKDLAGVGFVITAADPFMCVDLDSVRDAQTGQIEPWAQEIVDKLCSYTEVSPRGEGVHVWLKNTNKDALVGCRQGQVEIYGKDRYMTVTGDHLPGTLPTVEERQAAIESVHQQHIYPKRRSVAPTARGTGSAAPSEAVAQFTDDTIMRIAAVIGAKDGKFSKLHAGDWAGCGYTSQSEGELAYVGYLVRAGADDAAIDRIFRASGLFRAKWDRTGEKTIATARDGHKEPERFTGGGNASRFVRHFGDRVRYCEKTGWHVYDGRRWAVTDGAREVQNLMQKVVKMMYAEFSAIVDPKDRETALKWAMKSDNAGEMANALEMVKSRDGILTRDDQFDANPWVLNVLNGTVTLRDGDLHYHAQEDLITKLANAIYDPKAQCPKWLAHLDYFLNADADMINFLQRAIGYTLTGDIGEQCMFILHGEALNGKSTIVEVFQKLLGDYCVVSSVETFIASKIAKKGGDASDDVARMAGARLVLASEFAEGQWLSENFLKKLTSTTPVAARRLYKGGFQFDPQCKLMMDTNHLPNIRGTDPATERRIRVIPFEIKVDPRKRIENYSAVLFKEEASGILRWAVEGCLKWQKEKLGMPPKIAAAGAKYQKLMDDVGDFIEERGIVATGNRSVKTKAEVYAAYTAWCQAGGNKGPLTKKAFGMQLERRGFLSDKVRGERAWINLDWDAQTGTAPKANTQAVGAQGVNSQAVGAKY